MLTVKTILLATDFSEGAEARMTYARDLALRTGAELHMLYAHVLHGEPYERPEQKPETEAEAEEALRQLSAKVGEGVGPTIHYVVERNVTPAPAILDYAKANDVDVIVVGTHGRRGVRRLILGSVAEEVLRMAPCPVMTIRPQPDDPESARTEIDSLLVPVDFSKHSAAALRYAKELGALFGARLDLLHVVEETLHPAFYGIAMQSIYDAQPDIEEKSVAQMRGMFENAPGPRVDVAYEARPGRAGSEIVSLAEDRGSGLIVMGTHGLTGLEHFLMGSTTERVVRRSPAPVFTVKSFGKSLIDDTDETAASESSPPATANADQP